MLLVGLTGGIGSGKSTVARMLEERGSVVFDADLLAREAVEPGTPGHTAVIERLMRQRGMSEAAIRARIDAQAPLEDKAAVADFLVDNGGTLPELESQVERLWHELSVRAVA